MYIPACHKYRLVHVCLHINIHTYIHRSMPISLPIFRYIQSLSVCLPTNIHDFWISIFLEFPHFLNFHISRNTYINIYINTYTNVFPQKYMISVFLDFNIPKFLYMQKYGNCKNTEIPEFLSVWKYRNSRNMEILEMWKSTILKSFMFAGRHGCMQPGMHEGMHICIYVYRKNICVCM